MLLVELEANGAMVRTWKNMPITTQASAPASDDDEVFLLAEYATFLENRTPRETLDASLLSQLHGVPSKSSRHTPVDVTQTWTLYAICPLKDTCVTKKCLLMT
jgi:hypothetical protein